MENAPNATKDTVVSKLSHVEVIFSAVLGAGDNSLRRKQELLVEMNIPDAFRDEYYVFYTLVKDKTRIDPTEDFIELYLRTNRANFSTSPHIDLAGYTVGEGDPYVEFVNSVKQMYKVCRGRDITDTDFHLALEMHKMEFINRQSIEILEDSTIILSEGKQVGRTTLSGYADMRRNLSTKLTVLDNLVEKKDRKGTITYGVNDNEDDTGGVNRVCGFGIDELDNQLGGIYEGDMISLLAPAKGGKTRITTHVIHNGIISGQNIAFWSIENGYKGWEALLRARHFNYFYNKNVTDVEQKRIINSDMIRKGEFPSEELKALEQASWLDLRTNPAYGRITNIDADFNLDTYMTTIDNAVKEFGAKLISIDYLQLITGDGRRSKNEIIGEVYKSMLQFLKKNKIAGVFPAQLKQSFVGDISRKDADDLINMEMRDSAGESYEVIKTPDVNLALYGTVEGMKNGDMKILSIPSRNAASFDPIQLYADLGTCTFTSL